MRASGTFKVVDFTPAPVPSPAIETAVSVGVATMDKQFEGEVVGRSATLFTSAFDQSTNTGTYVAMESFEGALHSRAGTFNFAHSATMSGGSRQGGSSSSSFRAAERASWPGSPGPEALRSTRTARTGSGSITTSISSSAGHGRSHSRIEATVTVPWKM